MAYARTADAVEVFMSARPRRKARRTVFARIFDAVVDGRRHAAERRIAAYLQGSGDFLTDEAERQIECLLRSPNRL